MAPLYFYLDQWSPVPAGPTGDLLTGKTVIVTGGNSGIGLAAAHQLAALRPARLILACRSLQGGRDSLKSILEKYPGTSADVWELDLKKYGSVKAFSERATRELGKVDLLLNNAGLNPGASVKPLKRTEDGHEFTFQVNVLSPLLMTLLLRPLLDKSEAPRVVFTTSEVHAWADPSPIAKATKQGSIIATMDDDDLFDNIKRYFQTKLLLQMIIRRLIPAMPGIRIVSVNPGLCRSNFGRHYVFDVSLNTVFTALWFMTNARSANAGARNVVSAAVSATDSHEYYSRCEPASSPSAFLGSGEGMVATRRFWKEAMGEMEKISPGCTQALVD